jgi:hypothetical protein
MATRNAVRNNARRTRREKEAMENIIPESIPESSAMETPAVLEKLMPFLDEGLQTLPEKDREVVVLRFFSRKSLGEIGGMLAISEDAAQKRVSRALERLRSFFHRRGHGVSAGAALALLTAAGSVAAPVGIASAVAGVSCAAVSAAGAAGWLGSITSFITGTTEQIVFMKTKLIIACVGLAAVGTPLVMQNKTLAALKRDYAMVTAATRELDDLKLQERQAASQRQIAAEWAQHQRDLEELQRLRDESQRLSEAAVAHPESRQRLAAARSNYEAAKASATLEAETMQAEELRVHTVDAMKHLGLAARIFAVDNKEKFPKTFEEIKRELPEKLPGDLALDRFEFVEHEREISEAEPQLILFREKQARRLPNGKWTKAYTMADGSVQNVERDTPDFSDWEEPLVARKQEIKEQASR